MSFELRRVKPVLCKGPLTEISKKLCESGGLVMGIETTGVGKYPDMTAAEAGLLKADAGGFVARDDTVRTDTDERGDGGAPALHLNFEPLAAGAKLFVAQLIGTGGRAFDDVYDMPNLGSRSSDSSNGENGRGVKPPA